MADTGLKFLKCNACGKLYVPPKYLCTQCDRDDFAEVFSNGIGEVYSFTIIRMSFEEFADQVPYAFGEIRMDEGLVVPGRFTNEKEKAVAIGSKVSFVKREGAINWFQVL